MTIEILLAMVSMSLFYGEVELAGYLCLSFHCMLRTEEGLRLRVSDLTVAKGRIRLRIIGKSGNRFGTTEDVVVEDQSVISIILWLMKSKLPSQRIYTDNGFTFRRKWKWLVQALALDEAYQPYGLRRGGATATFVETGSYDATCEKNVG